MSIDEYADGCYCCKFWKAISGATWFGFGFCRRYAPRPVSLGGLSDVSYDPEHIMGEWPKTAGEDYCGEFEHE